MTDGPSALAALRGRRVLVTGHTGFKGSWLVTFLDRLGAHVLGYALAPLEPSLHVALDRRAPEWGFGDVRDRPRVREALRRAGPEVVVHLAAQPFVRRSYAEPAETFSVNVEGTVAVLEEIRRASGVRAVVVATSDKCYRNDGTGRAFVEEDPLGGSDPYSASKAAAEIVAASYAASFLSTAAPPVALATVRAGNVLGGGDWGEDRLLPDLVRSIQGGRDLEVRNPDAVRPWQHVLDVCHGYARAMAWLLDHPGGSRAWNLGPPPGSSLRVRDVLDRALHAWGGPLSWRAVERADAPEAPVLQLDPARARRELGWRTLLTTEEAIDWTVEWHRGRAEGGSAAELCRTQIERFFGRAGA